MWEFCIHFESRYNAESFAKKIADEIKHCGGIIVNVFANDYYNVLCAVKKEFQDRVCNYIKEKLAEFILTIYKKDYILSRLHFEKPKSSNIQIFLKALICFDTDIDRDIILGLLNFSENFYVGAFLNFNLKTLKKKWDELISLANENFMYLINEENLFELVKFLVSNLEYRYYAVNVFFRNNCYLLCDLEGKVLDDYMLEKYIIYDDNNLMQSLIALNPEKIILHCDNFLQDKVLKNLYSLFNNRIEIST